MPLYEFIESIRIAFDALRANFMRSLLGTLGVVVGVTFVILMGWALEGLDSAFDDTINIIGSDMLYVDKWEWAGGSNWRKLEARKDITYHQATEFIEKLTTADIAMPIARRWGSTITYGNDKMAGIAVIGTTSNYAQTPAGEVSDGRFFSEFEDRAGVNVVVIGFGVAKAIFPDGNAVHQTIKIGGHPFQVIGVVEKRGTALMDFVDNQIFIPISAFFGVYGVNRNISIGVKAGNIDRIPEVRSETIGLMRQIRNLEPGEEEDFSINETQAFKNEIAQIRAVIWASGIGLMLISFTVGIIGIMNIMFVSVTERTKEIGIRKAIGARRLSILLQFLVESAALCLAGALVAIPIGAAIIFTIRSLVEQAEFLPAFFQPQLLLIASTVSIIVGIIAGMIPAFRASRLDPVEALRYE